MSRTEADLREFYAQLPVSDDAEQRLQQWIFDQGATGPASKAGFGRAVRSRRVAVMAAVAVVAAIAVAVGIRTWGVQVQRTRPLLTTPTADTFVTVAYGPPGTGAALQLRRASDGRLVSTVLRTAAGTTVTATRTADGRLLVALVSGCTSRLERVDSTNGRTTTLRTLAEPVLAMALSPDGEQLAYLTQTSCVPTSCPSSSVCAGLNIPPPRVLVVLDLSTGHSVRAVTANYRHAIDSPSWSPDGRAVLVGFEGNSRKIGGQAGPEQELVVLDATHPDFRTARHIPDQPGCSYFAPSWTKAGIVAAQGCRPNQALSQDRLVRITASGVISAKWPLPACSGVSITRTDQSREDAFVDIRVGYGNGPCGEHWATRISRINGSSLHTVMTLPGASVDVTLDG